MDPADGPVRCEALLSVKEPLCYCLARMILIVATYCLHRATTADAPTRIAAYDSLTNHR